MHKDLAKVDGLTMRETALRDKRQAQLNGHKLAPTYLRGLKGKFGVKTVVDLLPAVADEDVSKKLLEVVFFVFKKSFFFYAFKKKKDNKQNY